MPLPAEKGLKQTFFIICEHKNRDLMPLPAEKGLKQDVSPKNLLDSIGFDAPSSRKRIETAAQKNTAISYKKI